MLDPKPAWKVATCSVPGARHRRSGCPCQDSLSVRLYRDFFVGVVADGAGSARHGGLGAQTVARAVAANVQQRMASAATIDSMDGAEAIQTMLAEAFETAAAALHQAASERGSDPREWATTLFVSIASPRWVSAYQIGDGAVVVDEGGRLVLLTVPAPGEFANETLFLETETLDRARFTFRDHPPSHVVLFSDGLERLAVIESDRTPFEGFFRPILKLAESGATTETERALEEFLLSERVSRRTNDDLTLIVASREP